MKRLRRILIVAAMAAFITTAAPAAEKRDDSAAERLGFRLSLQCYTFRRVKPSMTFFEIVDKAAALGIKYLDAGPSQVIKPDSKAKLGPDMSDDLCQEVKKKLSDAGGMRLAAFFVPLPADEASAQKTFEWARKMGVEVIVTETAPKEFYDALCEKYDLKIALHNHPKTWPPEQVLATCRGRSKRIGSCADTGHWMRNQWAPVDVLKTLEGRVVHLHLKDLNTFAAGHDVPWGTGKGQVEAVLTRLKQQEGFRGYLAIEYEHGSFEELERDLPQCIAFFDKVAGQLAK